jgi:hypothetical protein
MGKTKVISFILVVISFFRVYIVQLLGDFLCNLNISYISLYNYILISLYIYIHKNNVTYCIKLYCLCNRLKGKFIDRKSYVVGIINNH